MLTAQTVAAGASEDALRVPIVQGEFALARHCRLVGMLEIPATLFPEMLPAGSEVELMLELGRGGELAARARIVRFDIVVDKVARLVTPRLSLEAIDETLNALRSRLPEVSRLAFQTRDGRLAERLAKLSSSLAGIEADVAAFRNGDLDAGEQARRATCELDAAIADVEAELALPQLAKRVERAHEWALGWVAQNGDEAERRALANALRTCQQALAVGDPGEAERQLAIINQLGSAAFFREPTAWDHAFETAQARSGDSTDLRRATELVAAGRAAQRAGDRRKLEEAVRALWDLLPSDAALRAAGHGSGLRAP
jgi:molecular chaperone DnaK